MQPDRAPTVFDVTALVHPEQRAGGVYLIG